ncbi:shikimate kinase [Paeniglutamicibacter sp. R2-26]|uniref:shikimate kinase n=1 Tax=Paeniglutamicibacter sp. R2-26 TaxID=3144417 RepID=UPI003EE4487D
MSRTIFLIGPMASGKSAVGAELARLLGTRALDTDALVAEEHGPIPEIFERRGEPVFRTLETGALRTAARRSAEQGRAPLVVATGGGAVLAEENRRILADGFTVYLYTDAATVAGRIAGDATRPLLAPASGASVGDTRVEEPGDGQGRLAGALESWSRIFAERADTYEKCADLRVDTRTLGPAAIAEAIATAYRDTGH